MKLFVLGGSGLIGNALIKKASFSHEVLATYNNRNSIIPNVSMIKFCFPKDFENLKKTFVAEQPDIVINLIGVSDLDYCENNKEKAYKLNVVFTEKISKICNKINSKFVQISSDYVFDGKIGNYKENDKTNPINYYGYTKQMSEMKTLEYSNNIVIRTSLVYDLKLKTNFLKFVFEKLSNEEEIVVFDDISTTPMLIDELIEPILRIATSNKSGIFHISGDRCISRFEFAKIIAKKLGLREELIIPDSMKSIKKKISRPKNSCLNNNKIKETFGMTFLTLEENLDKLTRKR